MKRYLVLLSFIAFLGLVYGQTTETFWYNSQGDREIAFFQKDVIAFRLAGNDTFVNSYSPSIVRKAYTRTTSSDHLSIIEFTATAPDSAMENIRYEIHQLPNFECEYDVVSTATSQPNQTAFWTPVDDLILVTFRDPYFSTSNILQFANRHDLLLTYSPPAGLPENYSHCHIFKLNGVGRCEPGHRAIDVCQNIWEEDSNVVKIVEPNMVMLVRPFTNDPKFQDQWYVQNTGQPLASSTPAGMPDADHDIDWMWNLGYWGSGMKVAVIDLDGFDLGHEDMTGVFIDPWDAIDNGPLSLTNHENEQEAHGMCVSGIIAARSNNAIGLSGIAPESAVVGIKVNASTSTLVIGIQHALLNYDVDSLMVHVINMSLGYPFPIGNVRNELTVAKKAGRNGKGIIIVAAAGNTNSDTIIYPSAYPETISVGGSNPIDQRKVPNDNWNDYSTIWGSSYSNVTDVAAGSCLMWTTDHSLQYGYNRTPASSGNYYTFNGTSAATPIVSAVCALLLEVNPNLVDTMGTSWDVRDAIRNGAEKVNPQLYDYQAFPTEVGRSLEMGYGRLNGFNSLGLVSVKDQRSPSGSGFLRVVPNHEESVLRFYYKVVEQCKDLELTIFDSFGRKALVSKVDYQSNQLELDVSNISSGFYIAILRSEKRNFQKSVRFTYY